MRLGKVSLAILDRSVIRPMKARESLQKDDKYVGRDCAVFRQKEVPIAVTTNPVTIPGKNWGYLGIYKALANLTAERARASAVTQVILLPPKVREAQLKRIIEKLDHTAKECGIEIKGGHTEVTPVVTSPVVVITGIGEKVEEDAPVCKAGMDIVCTKWIGLEGSLILAEANRESLLTRYPERLVEEVLQYEKYLNVLPEAEVFFKRNLPYIHDISQGGIFGALYEMTEHIGLGIDVDLKKIPIKQETVEVCEWLDRNPYTLLSGGSMLVVCEDGDGLIAALNEQGIFAAVIGKTTDTHDKIIRNGEDIRYLDTPQTDEIFMHYFEESEQKTIEES